MNAVETVFRAVVDVSWRSSCLVLVVLALRLALRGRVPARVMSWVWIAVAVRLLFPFALPTAWSPFNFASLASPAAAEIILPRDAVRPPALGARALPPARIAPVPAAARTRLTPAQWAAWIWGAGVIALVLARAAAYRSFRRTLRNSGHEPKPETTPWLAEAAEDFGARPIAVTLTDAVCAPALHGIFRPRLLFPAEFLEKLTAREIRLTVAHELAHVERRDLLASALMHAALVLHWFNPLVWLVARVARNDCELACDELVIRRLSAEDREHYGATLLRIVSLANGGPAPRFGLGVVESKQQIKRRIKMIAAPPTSTLARTLFGSALFAGLTVFSFTRETAPQTPTATAVPVPDSPPPARTVASPADGESKFVYDASTDRLDSLFPTGVVATVGDRNVTVSDIRREIAPLIAHLQRDTQTQDEFNQKVSRLQNSVIEQLIGRIVLIKKFHDHPEGVQAKFIPEEYINNRIADVLSEQFGNDRDKFLAYLRGRGLTMEEYRTQTEEDIIYHYMRGQERNADKKVKEQAAANEHTGPQVHLRILQLKRAAGETDEALLARANTILARVRAGENFASLAQEFSADVRRNKGGDWGWQGPDAIKAEFRETLFTLKKGETSAPLIVKDDCFLLHAEDRR